MAGRSDDDVDRGDIWNPHIVWGDANGDPYDITGYDARLAVWTDLTLRSAPVVTLTVGDGITLDGPEGAIDIVLSAERLATLPGPIVFYSLEVTSPGGVQRSLLKGYLRILEGDVPDA